VVGALLIVVAIQAATLVALFTKSICLDTHISLPPTCRRARGRSAATSPSGKLFSARRRPRRFSCIAN
jgi:hypothetical protein